MNIENVLLKWKMQCKRQIIASRTIVVTSSQGPGNQYLSTQKQRNKLINKNIESVLMQLKSNAKGMSLKVALL